ncbi:aminopeptidase P N-terminal domain-containing protein [Solemya elarraichensis gill symbiont]|uniref:Xaa-Pro aminopeptidase n=1 Tax=Solemya elarraichensis gill symbiont TaxID=1918949 RepID=A0A1T2L3W4_9GAMM|nr:aminopeptidase P N-terminal domain-containing protein [Solemya elarraichensis gill symbiont]OOZ39710.1 Xaa-Pro aminopeptidase [Solemya elarraichensis gill symbiont]
MMSIPTSEFKRRRKQLMRMMDKDSIAIIPTAQTYIRNRDVEHPFRPDSDFHYLTGFSEPEAVAVLIPNRKSAEYILFCREKDPERELWDGLRAGLEGATEIHEADDAFPIDSLDEILPRMLEQCERVYYAMGCNHELDHRMSEWIGQLRARARTGVHGPLEFIVLDHYLHDMRLYKSRSEQKVMRAAAKTSAAAHIALMKQCEPGMYEYQLQAEFAYQCAHKGATSQAYPSIVGGGNNACILHYTENSELLVDGDLVLIDAGCENSCYASDITRTFPVNGTFSEPQRQLYQLVLDAQKAALEQIKPGNHWNDPHDAAVKTITHGLHKLGLLKGKPDALLKDSAYTKFYMHKTGHWLGMDVHDVGDYKIDGQWRMLESGMVLTVEPGIYIPLGSKGIAKKWQGIGIRIEDDVLVTKQGYDILSKGAPKEIDEIEALMAS